MRIAPRNWTEDDAATRELRRARGSLACSPRPLLAVRLCATTRNESSILGAMRARTPLRELAPDFSMIEMRLHIFFEDADADKSSDPAFLFSVLTTSIVAMARA